MKKIIKTRLEQPYKEDGTSANFPVRKKAGCYMIYKNEKLVYIGHSGTDVYRTMYRHFQSWKDRTQFRAVYNRKDCKVRVIYTNTATQAANLETALITKYQPKDNEHKLQSILNFHETKVLTEFTKAPTAFASDYKEDWE